MDNYAFIDSQNLNLSIKQQGWKLDFKRFRIYLQQKYNVTKAFLFIGYIASNQRLYDTLQSFGYILIFKPTMKISTGEVKGNVDSELVLNAITEISNYNKAIIVAGDGDYACLVEYLLKQNKLEKLIIPDINKYSFLLTKFLKHAVFMNNLRNKLENKKRQALP
ncbi:MAG: NYN domain-containing protein [Actinobacteria bacterium]|nr:NYN domain-containing protein [Actinomycetota bacterium]